jgi:adenosylcobinamide-GDP ribazoletransferase
VKHFLSAVRFLTVIPGRSDESFDLQRMSGFFPLVGLLLGGLLLAGDLIFSRLWSVPVAAWLDVVLLLGLTGGLHVDGLGDAGDGLLSHRSPERMLAIMKDSRLGVMGLLAVLVVLGLKWAGLSELGEERAFALLLVPGYSRLGMLFGLRYLPYGRPQDGIGTGAFASPLPWSAFWMLGLLVPLSLLMGRSGLWLMLGFAGLLSLVLVFYRRRLGCITGDMLGAMNEVLEAGLFLLLAAA